MNNFVKWENYKLAWDRINHAKVHGCGIEIVAISESIINDRLYSFIEGQPNKHVEESANFCNKINAVQECIETSIQVEIKAREGSSLESCSTNDLFSDVHAWREKRNKVIHGIARPESDRTPNNSVEFEELLAETANQGENLARMVIKWHGQALAEHKKMNQLVV